MPIFVHFIAHKIELMQVALPQFMREDSMEGNTSGTDQVVKMAILYSNPNRFDTIYASNHVTFLVCQLYGPGSQCRIAALAFMMFWIPIVGSPVILAFSRS